MTIIDWLRWRSKARNDSGPIRDVFGRIPDLSDSVERIGSLTEMEAALPEILALSTRARTAAAVQWIRLRWPGDDLALHKDEAWAKFNLGRKA